MTSKLRAAWQWVTGDTVLFTSPGIARVFMQCAQCRRVRPAWDLVKSPPYKRFGCKCGARTQRPCNIPAWRAAWWLLIVGVGWRKWLLRRSDWDPRMPMRNLEPGEF